MCVCVCVCWGGRLSPVPAVLAGLTVLLHDGGEAEQGELLQQVELGSRLTVDLQGGGSHARTVRVLEAVPAKLPAGSHKTRVYISLRHHTNWDAFSTPKNPLNPK